MNIRSRMILASLLCAATTCALAQVECKNHYILAEPCESPPELRWLDTTQPSIPHGAGHTATLLTSGGVLVAGGTSSEKVAQLYDPAAATWTMAGTMGIARMGHQAVLLRDGRVLVVGGDPARSLQSTAEIFDPATLEWTPASPLALHRPSWRVVPRPDFTATRLPDGRVLVVGGNDPTFSGIREAEIYDPASDTWQLTARSGVWRVGHSATLLADGRVLVAGGVTDWDFVWLAPFAETYDPRSDSWARAGIGPARFDHSMIALGDGTVLFAAGAGPVPGAPLPAWMPWWIGGVTETSVAYDARNGTWTPAASLNAVSDFHISVNLGDRVVAFLQFVESGRPLRLEVYSPAARAWFTADAAGTAPSVAFTATKIDTRTALFVGPRGAKLLAY
jgi:hypothetical protein